MKLEPTTKREGGRKVAGSGWVLYGNAPGKAGLWTWFERRFPSAEAAVAYATKRGWEVETEGHGNGQ